MVRETFNMEDNFAADIEYGDVYIEWSFVLLNETMLGSNAFGNEIGVEFARMTVVGCEINRWTQHID